jgi:hypothetical protein
MNFSLSPSKQADSSFLSRAPAEIRNEIYTLCGFKDNRIHLYELPVRPCRAPGAALTCQLDHNETFGLVYISNMFVIPKYVFGNVLQGNVVHKQKALGATLARIQRLQLDLGYGSLPMVQSKHATLRSVKEHAADLQELCVTFTTCLQGLLHSPIDDESLVLLSRFRGLKSFKLVVKNARDTYRSAK